MRKSSRSLYLAGLLNEEGEVRVSHKDPKFLAWLKDFERRFPTEMPSGLSREDLHSLYIGRVIVVLDEFGETSRWSEFAGSADFDATVRNYDMLIDRLIKTYHSGMYQAYWDYHNLTN